MTEEETVNDNSTASEVCADEEASCRSELVVAKNENRWVWRLRLLVAFCLLSATIAVCLVVYFQGRRDEQDAFEKDFSGLADKLVVSFESVVKQRFGAIELFLSDITANANQSWPLVTPPYFATRCAELHGLAQLSLSTMVVKVEEEDRPAWEKYSVENQGWRKESLAYTMKMNPEEVVVNPIPEYIFSFGFGFQPVPETTPGPYYPAWTEYPTYTGVGGITNWNIAEDQEQSPIIDFVTTNKKPAFARTDNYLDEANKEDGRYTTFKLAPTWDYQDDAFTISHFPVYDQLGDNRTVAAVFITIIYWRSYMNGLLPQGADGIYVVLENTCGEELTYQVDGLGADFVSYGDLHSEKYDYLMRRTSLDSILHVGSATDDATCHYSIRVYPSDEFREKYHTAEPWYFSLTLAAVFSITAAVFIMYDLMVERRQKAVMKSAQQSGKIVHSLFPEAVRDRLYEEQETSSKGFTRNVESPSSSFTRKEAIAAEYPETTVFFADLVGFTKWSATRTPAEVFQLLETLYGAFDSIARRKSVFKVETIGDCYVAVAGLPTPQWRHAEIMVKFSNECLSKMRNVVLSLVDTLGDDTANLAMRIGLHSGPVTGGVLRGQKSRFQLFGDTVNTASRMESNGMGGKIHVSQSTADELEKLGRSEWLVANDRKLPIKGKGEMQTYFVQVGVLAPST